jgi:hypothetical protein
MRGVHLTVLGCMAALVSPSCGEACACPPLLHTPLVSGQVTLVDGAPVRGARVRAYSAAAMGCVSLDTDFGFIETAANGRFRMGLTPILRW